MPKAIVLDGHLKSSLAVVRSLSRTGVRVACGAEHSSAPALHSRGCTRAFTYPSPLEDLDGFMKAVNAQNGNDTAVLFTFSDRTTLAVSRNRDKLHPEVLLMMPSREAVEACFDKQKLLGRASEMGIPVPVPGGDVFPVIVKPRFNVFWHGNQGVGISVRYAFDVGERDEAVRELRNVSGQEPMVQKYFGGREFGISGLCENGRVRLSYAHERIRSLHPLGGAAVVKRTIELPEDIHDAAHILLRDLSWTGPFMVEFKGDPEGEFILMELNGRFWGSVPLGVFSGVDVPLAAYRQALGKSFQVNSARLGVVSRHLLGDAGWLWKSLFPDHKTRKLSPSTRFGAMKAFLAGFSPLVKEDMWRLSDPAPFFWDIWHTAFKP